MDLSPLPADLRAEVERRLEKKPATRPFIQQMLAKRAAATTDEERARVDQTLRSVLTPSRFGLWIGLVVALLMGSILAFVLYREHEIEQAVAAGTPTTARIERMESGDCTIGVKGERCLKLTLTVYPEGRAPYPAELTQNIALEWMSRVQPGSWLTVAVDPHAPQKVTFDERTMQVPPPAPAGS